jgi:hypothetical protein
MRNLAPAASVRRSSTCTRRAGCVGVAIPPSLAASTLSTTLTQGQALPSR